MDDLNQSLQTRVAIATGIQEAPSEEPSSEVSKLVVDGVDWNFEAVQRYYGIEELDQKITDQLKDVIDYYGSLEDSKDTGDILKAIRSAHMNMVQPEVGQTKLSQLADYVRIVREMNDAKKQKEAYERLKQWRL